MNHLVFILGGFGTVLLVLIMLWTATALIGRAFTARLPRTGPSVPGPATADGSGVPPHHLAAIAAAVAAMTDGRGRIVRVSAPPHVAAAWAQEARMEQFASHRVRWDWAVPGPPHVEHEDTAGHRTHAEPLPASKREP